MSIARKGITNADFLGEEITKELKAYSEKVDKVVQEEISDIAKIVLKDLKNNPNIPARTGKYKKSFYIAKLAQGQGYKRVAIANRRYQLTHLLENGHAMPQGGRSKSYKHWADAQVKAEMLYDEIRRALQK